jgi:hypothetical protein
LGDAAVNAKRREHRVVKSTMKDTEYIPVRLSHLLQHAAVGAIVRSPEYLMTIKDTRYWVNKDGSVAGRIIPYVEGVRSALEITQKLREPPTATRSEKGQIEGSWIPAQRFPRWMKCPSCHLMYFQPWSGQEEPGPPRCNDERCVRQSELEQVPWVMVHDAGHMADLPWHWLAHRQARTPDEKQCARDFEQAYLRLRPRAGGGYELRCERCKISAGFDNSEQLPFGKSWRQPWLRETPDEAEDNLARIVEVNDARVHASIVRAALIIPPESRIRRGSTVDRLYTSTTKRQKIEQARSGFARRQAISQAASELRCSKEEIEEALMEIERGYPLYGKTITPGLLLDSEYGALIERIPDMKDDEDFVTRHMTEEWQDLASQTATGSLARKVVRSVDRVVAVSRLKEIRILQGFQRMNGTRVPPDIVGESDWLPALELYGEGVFFTLDEASLRRWEAHPAVEQRARDFAKRFEVCGLEFQPEIRVDPRFLLLHTISHMLIRELESEAGYPAASIKERIYCSAGTQNPMSGILVYVAVPDVVGSLGGLAELAEPRRFLRLLTRVFEHADWCSLDPVCAEHEGQGPNLLNRAACHACALVPEPSCVYGNMLLDRSFLKGSESEGMPGFLDAVGSSE